MKSWLIRKCVNFLRRNGIEVIGWQFSEREVMAAIQHVRDSGIRVIHPVPRKRVKPVKPEVSSG
jgi:hypothetical protein